MHGEFAKRAQIEIVIVRRASRYMKLRASLFLVLQSNSIFPTAPFRSVRADDLAVTTRIKLTN